MSRHVYDSHSVHIASRSALHKGVTDGRLVVGKVTMGAQISRNIMSLRGPVGATAAAAGRGLWAVAAGRAMLQGPRSRCLHAANRCSSAPAPARRANYVFTTFLAFAQLTLHISYWIYMIINHKTEFSVKLLIILEFSNGSRYVIVIDDLSPPSNIGSHKAGQWLWILTFSTYPPPYSLLSEWTLCFCNRYYINLEM